MADKGITVGALANMLNLPKHRVFQFLRREKYLTRHNNPKASSVEKGLMVRHEIALKSDLGTVRLSGSARLTRKGEAFFTDLLKKEFKND